MTTKQDPMDGMTGGQAPTMPTNNSNPIKAKSKLEKHMVEVKKVRKVPTSIYLMPEVLDKLSETARKYKVSNSKMVEILVEMGLKGE